VCVRVCVRACVCVYVCAFVCVRGCVHARVHMCVRQEQREPCKKSKTERQQMYMIHLYEMPDEGRIKLRTFMYLC